MSQFKRRLGLLVAAIGVVVLASATYGFGAITADRVADIGTADDANALLGIENVAVADINVTTTRSDKGNQTLELTNTFESDLDTLVVSISSVSGPVDESDLSVDVRGNIPTGETATVRIYCSGMNGAQGQDVTVTFDITGSGDGISVETSEAVGGVDVNCPTEPTPTPTPTASPTSTTSTP